ncbi:MAG: hypothetical protein F6K35_15915 [Okeania sp. SIO2H7]|nr:hypothetical protein [Okeania sp. SIO2H7]
MKTPTNSQQKNQTKVPDPIEWVQEHHFLAKAIDSARHFTQSLSDRSHSADDEKLIDTNIIDFLRPHYSEESWKDVERYLLGY